MIECTKKKLIIIINFIYCFYIEISSTGALKHLNLNYPKKIIRYFLNTKIKYEKSALSPMYILYYILPLLDFCRDI